MTESTAVKYTAAIHSQPMYTHIPLYWSAPFSSLVLAPVGSLIVDLMCECHVAQLEWTLAVLLLHYAASVS